MDKFGAATFEWPALHEVWQKPLDPFSMDSLQDRMYLGRGSHMTLAVFIKTPGGDHRSPQVIQKRNEKRSQAKAGRSKAEGQQVGRKTGEKKKVAAWEAPGQPKWEPRGNPKVQTVVAK